MKKEFAVSQKDAGKRLDIFLKEHLPDASRAFLQSRIRSGDARVNDKKYKTDHKVRIGERITTDISPKKAELAGAHGITIPVICEDSGLLVINKPPGITAHPLYLEGVGTLANWVVAFRPRIRTVGDS